MTPEKLKSVFVHYRAELDSDQLWKTIAPKQFSEEQTRQPCWMISVWDRIAHLKFMCDEAQRFVDAGRVEKAMRWLGFLQGVFWDKNTFTLDDLKNHSRPDMPQEG